MSNDNVSISLGNDKQNGKRKININKEGIRIVKVAAFCFAIISFIATAQGLSTYVFDYAWQAYLVSFGIQSILFVFNLKLPFYFKKIGNLVPDDKKRRKNNSYKWTAMQNIIAFFYAMVVFSSSWFSYVFIVNSVYADTQYIDSNVVLDSAYREALDKTDRFIKEDIKVTQLILIKKLSELQNKINMKNGGALSEEELNLKISAANTELAKKKNAVETAKRNLNSAKNTYEESLNVRWRSSEDIRKEKEAYDQASEKLNEVQDALVEAQSKLEEIKNLKMSSDSVVKKLLQEVVKMGSNDEKSDSLKNLALYKDQLASYAIESESEDLESSEYTEIITKIEELNICIDNYVALRNVEKFKGNDNDLGDLKDVIKEKPIKIPSLDSGNLKKQVETWGENWQKRYVNLERVIKSVPNYYYVDEEYKKQNEKIIDFDFLKSYDKQKLSDEIDENVRKHLASINPLERARDLLVSKYPFLAWFSLLLACFLDVASLLAGIFIYFVSMKPNGK